MKIKNFSKYEIYPETGIIYGYEKKKNVGFKNKRGYWCCRLNGDDEKKYNFRLHRVIYMAVYGEIPKGYEVNHIDENKNNNCISNLNLLTRNENNNWGTRNERAAKSRINHPKISKKVVGIKNGIVELIFSSISEAERCGFGGHISDCCLGRRKKSGGYEWGFADDYELVPFKVFDLQLYRKKVA